MEPTNRMIRSALAALACAAIAGFAAAAPERDAAAALDPAVKSGALSLAPSAMTDQKDAQSIIANWPANTEKAAQAMIEKYGEPDGITDRMLVWDDKGPWKRVTVYREAFAHDVPMPHDDFLENKINYKVPANKVADLIRFNQALVIDETRGTLASHCDSEGSNILALNLADEIVASKRDVASAKDFLKSTLTKSLAGKSSPYMDKLLFSSPLQGATPAAPEQRHAPQGIPRQGY